MKRILVGVDASPASVEALRRAAEEARLRGASLEVLHAFEPHEETTAFPVPPPSRGKDVADPGRAQREAEEQLAKWLRDVDVDFEDLEVAWTVVPDQRPARALVERSADAEFVVVGSRGRGGFAGLRLGSVSEQVTRHAKCPVIVTRKGD